MKNVSKNPFWCHAYLEDDDSYCKLHVAKALDEKECELIIRPKDIFDENDNVQTGINIYIGNKMSTFYTELVFTKKEAQEFATHILTMLENLEGKNGD